MACHLEFEVIVIDDRPEFANAERFPMASRVMCMPFLEALDELGHPDDFYVILTRGHAYDNVCLEKILRRDYAYVGMIGSRVKVALSMKKMKEAGFPANVLAGVHTPVGLQIGAQTPRRSPCPSWARSFRSGPGRVPGASAPPARRVCCAPSPGRAAPPPGTRARGCWCGRRLLCGHHRRRRGGVSGQAGRPGDDEAGRGAGPQNSTISPMRRPSWAWSAAEGSKWILRTARDKT